MQLPSGFHIQLVSSKVPGARFMAFAPNGDLLVSETAGGQVVALRVNPGTDVTPSVVISGLELPHGLGFFGNELFIGTWTGITVLPNYPAGTARTLFAGLPRNGDHNRRALAVASDGSLYISSGSDCNVCSESDSRLATVMHVNADGSNATIYASGLRNASGLAFDQLGQLWTTVNQRDDLTPDHTNLPVDELDALQPGADYGWPTCYPDLNGQRQPNPEFAGASCAGFSAATLGLQAHSAPLQLAFYGGSAFPPHYRGAAFIAFHGSWDRQPKTGYKVVAVIMSGGRPVSVEDFATGWLAADEQTVRGRPAGIAVAPDGSLYVSDDENGYIYRIVY